ncbi:MAG: leucyl aminopeptidase [Alphaproteobacteria bacterium]|nr:leucyl aminopeptidase [Alphaproteobacteria bacterium]
MRIDFSPSLPDGPSACALGVRPGEPLTPAVALVDAAFGGGIARLLATARLGPKAGATADAVLDRAGVAVPVILVNLGAQAPLTPITWKRIGGAAVRRAAALGHANVGLVVDAEPAALADVALGARLGAYRFGRYRCPRDDEPVAVERITLVTSNPAAAAAWARIEPLAAAIELTRDLVNEPANRLTPVDFAARAEGLASLGIRVESMGPDRLHALGMGAMLAVAQGSENEPRLLVLRWNGAPDPTSPPIALVGKGLTFDCGGISIKKAEGMEEMKGDMAGGAAVVGAIRALAGRGAPINVVGVVGLVENMASGHAYRPGDVITSFSGQTIEVVDTDAEGRMVLADVLNWTARTHRPSAMVDLATLTGSIIAGLGHVYAGLFATDDRLAADLLDAASAEDEPLWRMPLAEAYAANLDSPIADLRQCAPDDARGDAPHAAQFLSTFVAGVPWAHLDIAGVEWFAKDDPLGPKGASGFGVRLLTRWAEARG